MRSLERELEYTNYVRFIGHQSCLCTLAPTPVSFPDPNIQSLWVGGWPHLGPEWTASTLVWELAGKQATS